ncbi:MAG: hypothetical protein MI974_08300 [Chitinophagales bacterium]|nr:hypothetical protein [Chitinophagales bacterium]
MSTEEISKPTNIKNHIRQLIANNQTEEALQALLNATEGEALLNFHNEGVVLAARFNQYEEDRRLGIADYDDLARTQIKINLALLDLAGKLPSAETVQQSKKKPGIRESKLKRYVLRFMVASKVLILGFLFILWDAGGFTDDQFIGTATLLVPLFTAYTVLMVRDTAKYRYVGIAPETAEMLVTHRFKWMAYFTLLGYTLAIALVLYLKPPGILDYKQMSGMLTLVETGIGVYVGEIVFALFKKSK